MYLHFTYVHMHLKSRLKLSHKNIIKISFINPNMKYNYKLKAVGSLDDVLR